MDRNRPKLKLAGPEGSLALLLSLPVIPVLIVLFASDPALPWVILVVTPLILSLVLGVRVFALAVLVVRSSLMAVESSTALRTAEVAGVDGVILVDLIVVIVGTATVIVRSKRVASLPVIQAFLPLLTIAFLVGTFFSPLMAFVPFAIRLLAPMSIYVIVSLDLERRCETRPWVRGVLVSMAVPLVMAFYQVLSGAMPEIDGHYRLVGPYLAPSPPGFSLYLLVIACLLYGLFPRRSALFSAPLAFGAVTLVLLTQTRGAIVGIVVSLALIRLLQKRGLDALGPLIFLVLLYCFLLPGSFVRFKAFEGVLQHDGRGIVEGSLSTRLAIQSTLLPYVLESPLTGRGMGSSGAIFEYVSDVGKVAPHNDYIYFAIETGIAGLIAYVVFQASVLRMLWKNIRAGWHSSRPSPFPALAFSAFLVVNVLLFFENPIFFAGIQMYLMTLVALGACGSQARTLAGRNAPGRRSAVTPPAQAGGTPMKS